MADTVTLQLTFGEITDEVTYATGQGALDAVIDAFIVNFPDEDEVFGLPEPITKDDLRAFVSGLSLDQKFPFSINAF